MLVNIKKLEKIIGYRFRNKQLLIEALTHPSYKSENINIKYDNQRLEYLGDAVLSLILADYLYNEFCDLTEGELSILRSNLSNDETLSLVALDNKIGEFLLLGKGEENSGGYERKSNLADLLEAILGAAWIDSKIKGPLKIIKHLYKDLFKIAYDSLDKNNPKGKLQEYSQEKGLPAPIYKVISVKGPNHCPEFTIELEALSKKFKFTSSSKKDAEKKAAQYALDSLKL